MKVLFVYNEFEECKGCGLPNYLCACHGEYF